MKRKSGKGGKGVHVSHSDCPKMELLGEKIGVFFRCRYLLSIIWCSIYTFLKSFVLFFIVEENKDRERNAMEREITDLRGQLSRAISASSEAEELRRGIERSERQRAQLSDHIEVKLFYRSMFFYYKEDDWELEHHYLLLNDISSFWIYF